MEIEQNQSLAEKEVNKKVEKEEEKEEKIIYPRYFLHMLTVDGDGEYDAMDFEQEGFDANDGVQFCLVNDGSYSLEGERICANLSLSTYFFSTAEDRDSAQEVATSVHEELQTYDRSKAKEVYFIPGCYNSAEEEEKCYAESQQVFENHKREWKNSEKSENNSDNDN